MDIPERPDPADFEKSAGFRATVLYLLHPEHVETVRQFGRLLYHLVLAGDPYFPEEESQVRRELEAAREDLLHLWRFLAFIARKPETLDLDPRDVHLCRLAGTLERALTRAIQSLDRGLTREPRR